MPDLKITQFSAIVVLDNTDVLAIVDLTDNTTKKVTVAQLKALATFVSLTTTGTSGPSTLVAGVLNVPIYPNGTVTSVGVTSGTSGSDVNVTGSPITSAGSITVNIPVASAVNTGKLSSADFTAFNNKQNAITLTTTGTSGAATLVGATLNVPNYATATVPGGTDGQVQYNNGGAFGGGNTFVWDDINNHLGIGALTPTKKLEVFSGAAQTVALFDNDAVGSIIAFKDGLTTDDTRVGVGALADLLILRGNGNATGTVQIGLQFVDFQSNEIRNFIPRDQTTAINLTIDATNFADYNGSVLEVTGALTVTIDGGVSNRFNISVIQMDANQTTFVGAGGVTLRNRQGHTKTFGQYSTVTLYVTGNDLILAGDTAP